MFFFCYFILFYFYIKPIGFGGGCGCGDGSVGFSLFPSMDGNGVVVLLCVRIYVI